MNLDIETATIRGNLASPATLPVDKNMDLMKYLIQI